MTDITKELSIGSFNDEELYQVILDFYTRSSGLSPNEIGFSRDQGPHAVKITYRGSHIIKAETGPGFQVNDLENLQAKIATELAKHCPSVVGRWVLFSSNSVDGHFASPYFQILPVPSHAPKPMHSGSLYNPFLLEVSLSGSSNTSVLDSRRSIQTFQIMLFLNAVLKTSLRLFSNLHIDRWIRIDSASHRSEYKYCPEGYSYDGFKWTDSSFSTVDHYSVLRVIEASAYYAEPEQAFIPLTLPDNIDHLINIFFSMGQDRRDLFLRAAYWFHQARVVDSRSSSFINLICCIDTLVPRESAGPPCISCNRAKEKSLTQSFVDFLEAIVPEQGDDPNEIKEARKKLCRLRGDLAHGRDILDSDWPGSFGSFNPEKIAHWNAARYASDLARLALVNWLRRERSRVQAEI